MFFFLSLISWIYTVWAVMFLIVLLNDLDRPILDLVKKFVVHRTGETHSERCTVLPRAQLWNSGKHLHILSLIITMFRGPRLITKHIICNSLSFHWRCPAFPLWGQWVNLFRLVTKNKYKNKNWWKCLLEKTILMQWFVVWFVQVC